MFVLFKNAFILIVMDFSNFYERRLQFTYPEYMNMENYTCDGDDNCRNELDSKGEIYCNREINIDFCGKCYDKLFTINKKETLDYLCNCYNCEKEILKNIELMSIHNDFTICMFCYDNYYETMCDKITNSFITHETINEYFQLSSRNNPFLKKYNNEILYATDEILKHISDEKDAQYIKFVEDIGESYGAQIDDIDVFKWTFMTQYEYSTTMLLIKCEPPYKIATVNDTRYAHIEIIYDSYIEFVVALENWVNECQYNNLSFTDHDYNMFSACQLFPENQHIKRIISNKPESFVFLDDDGDY